MNHDRVLQVSCWRYLQACAWVESHLMPNDAGPLTFQEFGDEPGLTAQASVIETRGCRPRQEWSTRRFGALLRSRMAPRLDPLLGSQLPDPGPARVKIGGKVTGNVSRADGQKFQFWAQADQV